MWIFSQHGLFSYDDCFVSPSPSLPSSPPIVRVSFSLSWTPRDGIPFVLLFFTLFMLSFLVSFWVTVDGFSPHPLFPFFIPRFPDVHWTLAVPLASFYTKCLLSLSSVVVYLFSLFLYYSAPSPSLINEEPRLSISFVVKNCQQGLGTVGLAISEVLCLPCALRLD